MLERLLRARLVTQKAVMGRALSFEYLNRQLVWHELSELMLFVLPLLRVTQLKRLLQRHLPPLAALLQPSALAGAPCCSPAICHARSSRTSLQQAGKQASHVAAPPRRVHRQDHCIALSTHLEYQHHRHVCLSRARLGAVRLALCRKHMHYFRPSKAYLALNY